MKAIYPCSFDPIHNGHIEVIKDAAQQYEHLFLLVANNETKKYQNTLEIRKEIVEKAIKDLNLTNIEVVSQEPGTFTPNIARELGAEVVVRGLPTKIIPKYEEDIAEAYLEINNDLSFNYVITAGMKITSEEIVKKNSVKEDIKEYVPASIEKDVVLKWR